MNAPVEEGEFQRLPGSDYGTGLADRWRHEMHYGLGDTKEHQSDAHARGKHHGEPGSVAVVRGNMIRTQFDITITTDADNQYRYQDDGHHQHIVPAAVHDNRILH